MNRNVQADKHKMNFCVPIKKTFFGEDARASTGLCMIVFSIPLLIPGVVITAVAFQDETGFSRFGGLHVFGMVLLAADVLLLIAGIMICIRFQSKVGPENSFQSVSTHVKKHQDATLGKEAAVVPSELPQKYTQFSTPCYPSTPPVNYFLEKELNTSSASVTPAFSKTYQKAAPEQEFRKARFGDNDSSSYESSDSDECSSGSYIIHEDMSDDRVPRRVNSDSDLTKLTTISNVRNIAAIMAQLENANNYFQVSKENRVPEISEKFKNEVQHSSRQTKVSDIIPKSEVDKMDCHQNSSESITAQTHSSKEDICDTPHVHLSPLSRQRLRGISSEALLTSPKIRKNSENGSLYFQGVVTKRASSLDENSTGSRASVFSVAKELNDRRRNKKHNVSKKDTRSWCSELYQNSLTNSPYAARPLSYSTKNKLTTSANSAILVKESPSVNVLSRPKSAEGYIGTTKTMATMTLASM